MLFFLLRIRLFSVRNFSFLTPPPPNPSFSSFFGEGGGEWNSFLCPRTATFPRTIIHTKRRGRKLDSWLFFFAPSLPSHGWLKRFWAGTCRPILSSVLTAMAFPWVLLPSRRAYSVGLTCAFPHPTCIRFCRVACLKFETREGRALVDVRVLLGSPLGRGGGWAVEWGVGLFYFGATLVLDLWGVSLAR